MPFSGRTWPAVLKEVAYIDNEIATESAPKPCRVSGAWNTGRIHKDFNPYSFAIIPSDRKTLPCNGIETGASVVKTGAG
jgi:hypothetical protein